MKRTKLRKGSYDVAIRANKMHDLRFKENMSLNRIADIEGISHQRVSQIFAEMGGAGKYSPHKDTFDDDDWLLAHRHLNNDEMAKLVNYSYETVRQYRKRFQYMPMDGQWKRRYISQRAVEIILEQRGHTIKPMPHSHPFGILVGDKLRITIQIASQTGKMSDVAITKYARFHVNRKDTDIFVCCLGTIYFVIPSEKIRGNPQMIYIAHPPSKTPKTKDPYHGYKNRWDLIDEALKSVI